MPERERGAAPEWQQMEHRVAPGHAEMETMLALGVRLLLLAVGVRGGRLGGEAEDVVDAWGWIFTGYLVLAGEMLLGQRGRMRKRREPSQQRIGSRLVERLRTGPRVSYDFFQSVETLAPDSWV